VVQWSGLVEEGEAMDDAREGGLPGRAVFFAGLDQMLSKNSTRPRLLPSGHFALVAGRFSRWFREWALAAG